MHWFTFFKAIKESNVSVTLACISTGALFASVLEPIFFKRKLILYELLFGSLVVLGLIIIFNLDSKYHYGIFLALISAFLSAFFAVINGIFVNKYDAGLITFYELLGGVVFFSIILLFNNQFNSDFFVISKNDWIYLFILSSIFLFFKPKSEFLEFLGFLGLTFDDFKNTLTKKDSDLIQKW